MTEKWRPFWHEEDNRLVAFKPGRRFDQTMIGGWRGHPQSERAIARAIRKCQKWCDGQNATDDRIKQELSNARK